MPPPLPAMSPTAREPRSRLSGVRDSAGLQTINNAAPELFEIVAIKDRTVTIY